MRSVRHCQIGHCLKGMLLVDSAPESYLHLPNKALLRPHCLDLSKSIRSSVETSLVHHTSRQVKRARWLFFKLLTLHLGVFLWVVTRLDGDAAGNRVTRAVHPWAFTLLTLGLLWVFLGSCGVGGVAVLKLIQTKCWRSIELDTLSSYALVCRRH